MKKILFLITVMISSLLAEVHFVKDYKTALKRAKSENKIIMLMISSTDCQSCWWMKNVAFKDADLAARINENMIAVLINVDEEKVPMNLDYRGTPTFYFLNKKEDALSRMDGARKVKKFQKRLDFLLD